jgi:hypothetical protein
MFLTLQTMTRAFLLNQKQLLPYHFSYITVWLALIYYIVPMCGAEAALSSLVQCYYSIKYQIASLVWGMVKGLSVVCGCLLFKGAHILMVKGFLMYKQVAKPKSWTLVAMLVKRKRRIAAVTRFYSPLRQFWTSTNSDIAT